MGGSDSKPAKKEQQAPPQTRSTINIYPTVTSTSYSSGPVNNPQLCQTCRNYHSRLTACPLCPSLCRGCNTTHPASVGCPLLCQTCNTKHYISVACPVPVRQPTPASVSADHGFVYVSSTYREQPVTETKYLCMACGWTHGRSEFCFKRKQQVNVSRARVFCPNKALGCNEEYTTDHSKSCPYVKTACPVGVHLKNCVWNGAGCKLEQHARDAHPNNIVYKVDTENIKRNFSCENSINWDVQMISHQDQTFIFFMKVCQPWFYVAVQLVGSTEDAKEWAYRVNMYIKSHKKKRIILQEACSSNTVDIADIFAQGLCGVVPVHIIKNYITTRQNLNFQLSIFKHVKKQQSAQFSNSNRR